MPTLLRVLTPVVLAALLAIPMAPALAGGPNPIARPCGDANEDFAVNSLDALLALQVDAGLLKAPPMSYSFIEDWLFFNANLDKTINSLDALLVLQYDAGYVEQLPNCYDIK